LAFSILALPPPRSTLFPYTTLFRSLSCSLHGGLIVMATPDAYDLLVRGATVLTGDAARPQIDDAVIGIREARLALVAAASEVTRSEEHTSELQSRSDLVCRLLLEKK